MTMSRRNKTQKHRREQDGMGMFDYFFGGNDNPPTEQQTIPAQPPTEQQTIPAQPPTKQQTIPAQPPTEQQPIAPGKRKSRSRSGRRGRSHKRQLVKSKKTRGRGRKH